MVRLAVIMIVAVGLSHGIRIDILDKMANFNNLTEIEALEKIDATENKDEKKPINKEANDFFSLGSEPCIDKANMLGL